MVTARWSSPKPHFHAICVLVPMVQLSLAFAGCAPRTPQIPKNADPSERQALATVLTFAENASWNESGRLRSIHLVGDAMTDDDVKHIAAFSDLEELNLMAPIREDALAFLKGLPRLSSLGLAWTGIGDRGVEHLSGIKTLRCLVLDHTHITDASLKHLARLERLSSLFIQGTSVSDSAIETFMRDRPHCRVQK